MKRIIFLNIFIFFCAFNLSSQAYFAATFTNTGNKLEFKIKPIGGNITTGLTYFDFNIRYATTHTITFSNIVPNTSAFPGLNIQPAAERTFGGKKYKRFVHNTGTVPSNTYISGQEYLVFTVTLVDPSMPLGNFELCSDLGSENFFPNDYIFSVNNTNGLPITDQIAPFEYFYPSQSHPGGTEYFMSLNMVPLPVELIDFTAKEDVNSINLDWATASEINLRGYEIQRMSRDSRFEAIGFVNGTNSPNKYSFNDSKVELDVIYYYRLKILDLDGQFEYSNTESAIINGEDSVIKVFPNPVSNTFTISGIKVSVKEIEIFDNFGKKINNGMKVIDEAGNGQVFDISNFSQGTYFLRINDQSFKIIKI